MEGCQAETEVRPRRKSGTFTASSMYHAGSVPSLCERQRNQFSAPCSELIIFDDVFLGAEGQDAIGTMLVMKKGLTTALIVPQEAAR